MRLSHRDSRALTRGVLILVAIVTGSRVLPATLRWRTQSMAQEATLLAELHRRRTLIEARPQGPLPAMNDSGLLHARTAAEGAGRLSSLLSGHARDMRVQLGSMEPAADSEQTAGLAGVAVRAIGVADIAGLVGLIERLESDDTTIRVRSLRVLPSNPADGDHLAERLRFEIGVEALVSPIRDSVLARH